MSKDTLKNWAFLNESKPQWCGLCQEKQIQQQIPLGNLWFITIIYSMASAEQDVVLVTELS